MNDVALTGKERFFDEGEIIVTKTDLKGRITYANQVFCRLAGYTQQECLGKFHNIIRHPDMPRCVFKLLWDVIEQEKEIFAYVLNKSKNGDHYWVFAHVTPSYDINGVFSGYHSNRRVPDRRVVDEVIIPTYKTLLDIEAQHKDRKAGMAASFEAVVNLLTQNGVTYDEWIFSLSN